MFTQCNRSSPLRSSFTESRVHCLIFNIIPTLFTPDADRFFSFGLGQ